MQINLTIKIKRSFDGEIFINRNPDVRPHNHVEQKVTKIAETEEQQANNISEPEIDSDSSYKTKDVHTRKRMIKSVLETKIEQHCSPLEFMDLIENDGFLEKIAHTNAVIALANLTA
jgi:hypothetical protein